MERRIEAPPWEWGSREQASTWLGIPATGFDALVRAGKIPPGVRLTKKTVLWSWVTIWAVGAMLTHLSEGAVKPNSTKKMGSIEGK